MFESGGGVDSRLGLGLGTSPGPELHQTALVARVECEPPRGIRPWRVNGWKLV